jgi:hypothetical protein
LTDGDLAFSRNFEDETSNSGDADRELIEDGVLQTLATLVIVMPL